MAAERGLPAGSGGPGAPEVPGPVLRPATFSDRPVLEQLWQLYKHDLSELRGTLPDAHGRYSTDRLQAYLPGSAAADRAAVVVEQAGAPVGFVLLRVGEPQALGEFFVVRALRRKGVAYDVARALVRQHPGRWEIAFQEENAGAARLWRRLARDTARAGVREELRPVPGKPHVPPDVWVVFDT